MTPEDTAITLLRAILLQAPLVDRVGENGKVHHAPDTSEQKVAGRPSSTENGVDVRISIRTLREAQNFLKLHDTAADAALAAGLAEIGKRQIT